MMSESSIEITNDKSLVNVEYVHQYLSKTSYWAKGRSKEDVIQSIENSICFSVLDSNKNQIGFARVVTDTVVFAWIMDVFVDKRYQGLGIGKLLIKNMLSHPSLAEVNGIGLKTFDAHGLYKKYGFNIVDDPEIWMFKKIK